MANLMINEVRLCGRLGRDPELLHTAAGKPYCALSIAVQRPYKREDGGRDADFFRVLVWGRQAEIVCGHLRCGQSIYVEAELRQRSYLTPEGERRQELTIMANDIRFVDPRGAGERASAAPAVGASFDADDFFEAALGRTYGEGEA